MNPSFSQGETLTAKVSGNFFDQIRQENIFLYRNNLQIRVPQEFKVAKIGENYYLYGQLLGKTPNNYSLVLKDLEYSVQLGGTSKEWISKNFTITDSIADFSVDPGFFSINQNVILNVKNLKDNSVEVGFNVVDDTNYVPSEVNASEEKSFFEMLFGTGTTENKTNSESYIKKIVLNVGEEKMVDFNNLKSQSDTIKKIVAQSGNTKYELPIFLFGTAQNNNNQTENGEFEFLGDSRINLEIKANESYTLSLKIRNKLEKVLESITFSPSYEIERIIDSISPEEIKELKFDEEKEVLVKIKMPQEEYKNFIANNSELKKEYFGKIYARSKDSTENYVELNITFFKEIKTNETKSKFCFELGGKICSGNSTCAGETKYAKDGVCCMSSCNSAKPASLKIIGWIIIIILVLFLIWFFLTRYRGARGEVNLLDVAKRKSN